MKYVISFMVLISSSLLQATEYKTPIRDRISCKAEKKTPVRSFLGNLKKGCSGETKSTCSGK